MAVSENAKPADLPPHRADNSESAAHQAAEKLSAGAFDYPNKSQVAQLETKEAPKPDMATFLGQSYDLNKVVTKAEIRAARNEDRALLGIDPKDNSANTYFDKSAQVAVRFYKQQNPETKAELRKEFGLTSSEFADPVKVKEAQINYQRRLHNMPDGPLEALENRMHLVNAAILKGKLKTPNDRD